MQKRTLTVTFERAVRAGVPNRMEITLTPLEVAVNAEDGTVLTGGPQTKILVLDNDTNSITFELVPSEHPDLDQEISYRIAWRERYLGKQYTTEFTMPDQDVNFAELASMGRVLSIR